MILLSEDFKNWIKETYGLENHYLELQTGYSKGIYIVSPCGQRIKEIPLANVTSFRQKLGEKERALVFTKIKEFVSKEFAELLIGRKEAKKALETFISELPKNTNIFYANSFNNTDIIATINSDDDKKPYTIRVARTKDTDFFEITISARDSNYIAACDRLIVTLPIIKDYIKKFSELSTTSQDITNSIKNFGNPNKAC